jgi:ribosome-binding factor A
MPRGLKPPSQRQLRVGEELRHVIANLIERGEFRDPDLLGRAITVTEVRISPDLRNATVFVVPLGGGDATTILAGLKRAKAFLRQQVARAVKLRLVPELWFQADVSFDEANHIDRILRSAEVSRDLPIPPAQDEDAEDGE